MTDNPTPNDIALLREALKPFADLADWIDQNKPSYANPNMEVQIEDWPYTLSVAWLYDARSALAPGQHDGAAGEGPSEEWLNDPASLESGLPTIPAGMKPWAGGDIAPADWDDGPVWCDDGALYGPPYEWSRSSGGPDIIAYTPKPSTEQAEGDLGWNVPANLRWLGEQATRPNYVPCGALTGMFLNQAAAMIESLAAENFKLKYAATPSGADALGGRL